MLDLPTLRALALAATPGPWRAQQRWVGTPNHASYIAECRNGSVDIWDNSHVPVANASYIAALNPQTVLRMCVELEAARDLIKTFLGGDVLNIQNKIEAYDRITNNETTTGKEAI